MSYSEIVNEIQGDEERGIRKLTELMEAQKTSLAKIKALEEELNLENQRYNQLMTDLENVCKHLKKEPPFLIVEKPKVYQLSDTYQSHISDAYHLTN